jgi:cellulose biosynthesis protein BcsQ
LAKNEEVRRVRVIAVYSIKGGVGKTATAVNLSYLASAQGARTILLDLDPQGSATFYFRVRPARKFGPKELIRGGGRMRRKIRGTDYPNLDLLPSALSYRKLDIALDGVKRSKRRLRQALRKVGKGYDYGFLDCPPNITLVSENIFRAADHILVPFVPTTLSLLAFEQLVKFFDDNKLGRDRLLPFFSMVEPRKRMHRDMMEKMGNKKTSFLRTVVPYLSDIERMGVDREPVVSSKPRSLAAARYDELWDEVTGAIG